MRLRTAGWYARWGAWLVLCACGGAAEKPSGGATHAGSGAASSAGAASAGMSGGAASGSAGTKHTAGSGASGGIAGAAGSSSTGGSGGAGVCDLTGTFAVRTKATLAWDDALFGDNVVISAGTAMTVGYGLLKITRSGGAVLAESKGCGASTPDLCSPFFLEAYRQGLPDTIWDAATMPTFTVMLDIDAEVPGGTFGSAPSAAFLGFRFADGTDPLAKFPASATDPSIVWMDDDGDGVPGVTSVVTAPGARSATCSFDYAYLPVDPLLNRAMEVHVGSRTISRIEGVIDDCNLLSGELFTDSANGRVHGCTLDNHQPCDADQASYLDMQAAGQTIVSAAFTMVRLANARATCVDARSAAFGD